MKRIGIALGAGGARGLAHIVVLQAFEELGIRPSMISGTSIGAVIGAGFAAGLSTHEMKTAVDESRAVRAGRFGRFYGKSELNFAVSWLDPTIRTGGLIKGEKFIRYLYSKIKVRRFVELEIPLLVIATHLWKREQAVLGKGNVLKSVQASCSMPGLFTPVSIGGELYVDGGLVNPLPYDVLRPYCDVTVAVDVFPHAIPERVKPLRAQEVFFSAFQILQNSIVREKLKQTQPDILIRVEMQNVRALEFNKANSILQQALPWKEELKRKLIPFLD
jgi:NTE family protein